MPLRRNVFPGILAALVFATTVSLFAPLAIHAATTGVVSTLYTLNGSTSSSLIQASDGNFYGTFYSEACDGGVVYRLTPGGSYATVHCFLGGAADGFDPRGVIEGNDGNLYGVTYGGGEDDLGVLYRLTFGGELTVLHSFTNADGPSPTSLIQTKGGDFFGVAATSGSETIFEYSRSGAFSVIYTSANTDDTPTGSLLQASDGLIYGTNQFGGVNGVGDVFRFDPTREGSYEVVASFPGPASYPETGLVEAGDGALYGTTFEGGQEFGTIYKMTLGSVPTTNFDLHEFNEDQDFPSGLTIGGDGNLYGGVASEFFQFVPADSSLNFVAPAPYAPDFAPLQGADGSFYGLMGSAFLYKLTLNPLAPTPVILTASSPTIKLGDPLTLTWQVNSAFSQTMQNCWAHGSWSGSLALSGSQTITPTVGGPQFYDITCGGVESAQVPVVMTGGPDAVTFSPTSLTFSNTRFGTVSKYQPVTLTNSGLATLNITSILPAGPNASSFFLPGPHQLCGNTLPSGGSCSFDVAFDPDTAGELSAEIQVIDNAAGSPHSLTVSGTAFASGEFSISPASLTFPPTSVGSTSGFQKVTVTNTGDRYLTISNVLPAGKNAFSFFVPEYRQLCGPTVAAGASCTFDVAFRPIAKGPLSAVIESFVSLPVTTQSLPVTGTGR